MLDYPKDWEEVTLSSLIKTITTGKLDANNMVRNGKYRFYTCAKDYYYINNYAFDGEALLISGNGEYVGYVHYYKGKFNAYQRTYVLMNFSCNSIFLKYYLDYFLEAQIKNEMKNGNTPYIVKSTLEDFSVYIPTLLEQKAIAYTLMAFDRHIENLERLIEKKKMIRDGAVEDFMTGKTRIDGFEGEWEEKSIECITSQIITGGTPSTTVDSYWNGDIPWLSSTEINQKNIKRPTKFITSRGLEESSAKIAPKYSVLVALAGQGKTRGTAGYLLKDMAINQSLAALVCKNSLSSKFLFYRIDYRYDFLRELSSGDGGRGGLNKKLIMKIKLTIPTYIKEQEAIASILTSMDKEIENLEKEKAKIEKIKDGAMDDLLTGRVRLI